jgi:nitrite reductase/ring-hydroxylating ferredoxin subunit
MTKKLPYLKYLMDGSMRWKTAALIRRGGVLSEGLVSGEYVYCPVYDWKISLVDGKVQAPDNGQVRTYKIEIEKDVVFIVL